MRTFYLDSGQSIFERALIGLLVMARWAVRVIVYFPLWFTGYFMASLILSKKDNAIAWLTVAGVFTALVYLLLFVIKGMLIGFRKRKKYLWILLFIGAVSFTCIFPVFILFGYIHSIATGITGSADVLSWVLSIAFGGFLYSRYHWLTDIVPQIAYPAYRMGLDIASRL